MPHKMTYLQKIEQELGICMRELNMLQSDQKMITLPSTDGTVSTPYKTALDTLERHVKSIADSTKVENLPAAPINAIIHSCLKNLKDRLEGKNINEDNDWDDVFEIITWTRHTIQILQSGASIVDAVDGPKLVNMCVKVAEAIRIDNRKQFQSIVRDKRNQELIHILSQIGNNLHTDDKSYYNFQGTTGAAEMEQLIQYLIQLTNNTEIQPGVPPVNHT